MVFDFTIPLSYYDALVLMFGIIHFSVFILSLFVNGRFVAKADDRLYKNNLKLIAITLLLYMFYLIFPSITIVA